MESSFAGTLLSAPLRRRNVSSGFTAESGSRANGGLRYKPPQAQAPLRLRLKFNSAQVGSTPPLGRSRVGAFSRVGEQASRALNPAPRPCTRGGGSPLLSLQKKTQLYIGAYCLTHALREELQNRTPQLAAQAQIQDGLHPSKPSRQSGSRHPSLPCRRSELTQTLSVKSPFPHYTTLQGKFFVLQWIDYECDITCSGGECPFQFYKNRPSTISLMMVSVSDNNGQSWAIDFS